LVPDSVKLIDGWLETEGIKRLPVETAQHCELYLCIQSSEFRV